MGDGNELACPFHLFNLGTDSVVGVAGINPFHSVGSHHASHGRCKALGIITLAKLFQVRLIIIEVVQETCAKLAVAKGNQYCLLAIFCFNVLELEQVLDVEVSGISHGMYLGYMCKWLISLSFSGGCHVWCGWASI